MRWAFVVGLCCFVVVGCSSSRSPGKQDAGAQQQSGPPQRIGVRTNNTIVVTPAPSAPAVGRVAHVNASARFAVLTYPIGKLPPAEKRLSVYRNGMKVGDLKVTGPQRDQNTVADITGGEAQPGDEVRDN